MSWLWFSLSSVFLFALSNVIDKALLTHKVKNPNLPVIVDMFLGLLFAAAIVVFHGIDAVSSQSMIVLMGLGIVYLLVLLSYFKAMQLEEVSRVVPLYDINVLFVLVLSILFLGKTFEISQIGGILLLMAGGILISQHDFSKIRLGKAAFFVLLGAVGLSIYFTASDYLLQGVSVETFFVYVRIGAFLGMLPLLWLNRMDMGKMITSPAKYGFGIIVLSESITVISTFLGSTGIQQASGAFYSAIAATQPVFVFILATALSFFLPHILKEETGNRNLLQKGVAIILIYLGVLLLG